MKIGVIELWLKMAKQIIACDCKTMVVFMINDDSGR